MFETPFPEISEARDKHAAATQHPVLQQTPPASAVAKVDLLALAISRFGDWRAGAKALAERYRAVEFDLSTPKGYAELTKAIAEVRAPRFAAQNVSKASKSELAGISKGIGAEEAAVAAFLADTETRLVALRDAHDEKVKAEKSEATRIEAERIAGHQAKIATIKSYLARCSGLPSSRIADGIKQLAGQVYGDDWQEFRVPAANAQCEMLEAMRTLHAHTVEREAAEVARLEREAEVARQAAENARIAAEQAAQQAELDRQAAEFKANMARIAGHQRRIDEIKTAATLHEAQPAATIAEAMTAVAALNVSEASYQEMAPLAAAAQAGTLHALWRLHDAAAERERQAADAAAAFQAQRMPEPAPMLQDDCRGLSLALSNAPHAHLHATEAAEAISAAKPVITVELDDTPAFVPEVLPDPMLTLGTINERIAPLSITGAGLAALGFEPAGRRKAAVLFHETAWPAMCDAMLAAITAAKGQFGG